jgi:hypothetical protein
MAQQEPIDQRKLFTQTLVISMVIWLLVLMGWSYFSRPPVSDKPPDEVVREIEKLRAEKDYVEASRRAQELATRYRGAEYGALGILLEAKIFYEDKQDAREAYNRLRQLEELYPNTKIYQEQGRPLLDKVAQEIDQKNRQLPSYQVIDAVMRLFGFAGDARFILRHPVHRGGGAPDSSAAGQPSVRQHAQDAPTPAETARTASRNTLGRS